MPATVLPSPRDETWKLAEHVDEIFREYYRQWANNHDARDLTALHRSLTARGVNAEAYVREEFDWVRSAVGPKDRNEYLRLERKGRKFSIPPEWRGDILTGLKGWEQKMTAVGVVDYLGLTVALTRHLGGIAPFYTHILLDEAQDFGTTELRIVRKLVAPGPNDLFLSGDIAQTVLPKHRSPTEAGIGIQTRERIQQNYRNSREILAAAYELLKCNLHEEMFESEDLEILDRMLRQARRAAPGRRGGVRRTAARARRCAGRASSRRSASVRRLATSAACCA